MISPVRPAEVLDVEVNVDLRGAEIRVAEQLLNRPEVGTSLHQVSSEGMPHGVRGRLDAGRCGGLLEPLPNLLATQSLPVA